jgi:uncharacterized membrane protein (UPF0127 family)
VRVWNETRSIDLGNSIGIADSSATRRTGLLQRTRLEHGEGLWIAPCEAVHTFFMKFPIDIAFLSRDCRVLKITRNLSTWRVSACLWAHSVLELPAGVLEQTGTQKGDQLKFER